MMALQVFATEQEAVDHANQLEFAVLCLNQWGLSRAHAAEVAKRVLTPAAQLSESDAGWLARIVAARASFVRLSRPDH
jgi:hypothetical protein